MALPEPSNPRLRPLAYQHRQGYCTIRPERPGGILSGSADRSPPRLLSWGKDKPEAHVAVAFIGRIPVTVRRSHVPGPVVPAAAAIHAAFSSGQNPESGNYLLSETGRISGPGKIHQRPHVSHEFLFGPVPVYHRSFIPPKLIDKSLFALRAKPDMRRKDAETEKGDAVLAAVELNIIFEPKLQVLIQEFFQTFQLQFQLLPVITVENEVIHIAQISANPLLFFEPVVKKAQIKIGQVLGDQAADRQPFIRFNLIRGQQLLKKEEEFFILEATRKQPHNDVVIY